ncbi:transposase [Nostoc linckia z18]|uniref:Transposase n=2 Tax=Nostoc linckia TaxID=92942 RepID=A0A9Q5ZAM3_NOSLI|nr:transposase [Nostoc linckia]PHK39630.1 transposase [Nostoc linckia z15]PHK43321.1 transposase [Nostoc linckia z16]PHJ57710.1 transposase [Nostoc linckia z1]PHJ57908.1 transposase [Nostoc linckia z3]PHJ69393.1 transposase [Nostoc linckia z2]
MKYNPQIHDRNSTRLRGYDYSSAGFYFVTICTYKRQCLFGEIVNEEMVLNEYGKIVAKEWIESSEIRQEIELDEWIVMPNHFHTIIAIHQPPGCLPDTSNNSPQTNDNSQRIIPPMKPRSLSSAIAGFKCATTTRINTIRNAAGTPVWQRNYYEHIIQNQFSLEKIRQYIQNNPQSWNKDQLHPNIQSKW